MRHTFASIALAVGENLLAVSQALGHFDPGFTLREYGYTLPGARAAVANAINATSSGETEGTMTATAVTNGPTTG